MWQVDVALRLQTQLQNTVDRIVQKQQSNGTYVSFLQPGLRVHSEPANDLVRERFRALDLDWAQSKKYTVNNAIVEAGDTMEGGAIEYHVLREGSHFIGPEDSVFSRMLIATFRKQNKPALSIRQIVRPSTQLPTFEQLLGIYVPAPSCTSGNVLSKVYLNTHRYYRDRCFC
jgi:hypothetical protein